MLTCVLAVGVAPADGAGGPFIPSGVSGVTRGYGTVGPGRQGGEEFNYVVLGFKHPVVERISIADGSVAQYRQLDGSWALPVVTLRGDYAGVSADGRTLVLIEPYAGTRVERTRFRILDAYTFKTRERVDLDGAFSFDAISPDGRLIYLVQYRDPRNPLDYRVRAYDLDRGAFRPGAIVDPEEPGEKMAGQPVDRRSSPDGRWAYTLYGGGEETFIHALDTVGETAVCVDLEQFRPRRAFGLDLEVDPDSGLITVLDRHDPAAQVDPDTFEVGPVESPATIGGVGADAARSGWVGPIALAVGIGLAIAAAMLALRRRRAA
jgi:hypothetical protein